MFVYLKLHWSVVPTQWFFLKPHNKSTYAKQVYGVSSDFWDRLYGARPSPGEMGQMIVFIVKPCVG